MDKAKYKIGDTVRVVNTGETYTTYIDWAAEHGFASKYNEGKTPRKNVNFTVIAADVHSEGTSKLLYGIENTKNAYIIGERGLELVEEKQDADESADTKEVAAIDEKTMGENDIIGQDHNKKILKVAIADDLPTLIIGETGTGKTTIIREQAIHEGRDIIRFSITGETTVDEFVGKYELEAGKTVWRDGVLLDAMRNGKWLVADEVNAALPEILFVLHSLLDDDKQVTVTQHGGEVVKPHENFRFFATMNPTDEYAGTKELNKAFQSRFNVVLKMHYPSPTIESKIVAGKSGASMDDATKMADVAAALRKAKENDKIFYTCSTRDLIHWGGLIKHLNPQDAFIVSILNKCNGDEDEVKKIFEHVIGAYLKLEKRDHTLTVDWLEKAKAKFDQEKKDFEAHKEQMREEITQDIIRSLTTAGVSKEKAPPAEVAAAPVAKPIADDKDQSNIDEIFGVL